MPIEGRESRTRDQADRVTSGVVLGRGLAERGRTYGEVLDETTRRDAWLS